MVATIVLSADTSLDSAVQLNWTLPPGFNCTSIGSVAGYITITDTRDYISTPVDIYLTQDEIMTDLRYTVRCLVNGVKYAFCLSVYTTSFASISKSNIILDTPSAVPDPLKLYAIPDSDETPTLDVSYNVDVSLNIKVKICSNGGLPIDKIILYLVDVSDYSYVPYEYPSNAFTLTPNTCVRLPIGDVTLNKLYYIYGEAINESGSSKPSNRIVLNTTNKPSPVKVTQVVSGLDEQLKINLFTEGNLYPLVKATVMLWDLTDNSISDWSSTKIISKTFEAKDASGVLILTDLIVDNLKNATPYKVAAYVTNIFQDGDHVFFLPNQTLTGVPALLPTLSDFSGNFSITSVVNSAQLGAQPANGSLTVYSKNDNNLTGKGHFSFDPEYTVSLTDMSGQQLGSFYFDSSFNSPHTTSNLDILVGKNYKATITVSCTVPTVLKQYWETNPAGNWLEKTKTLENIVVDTTHKPSDLIVDSVVSGLDEQLEVNVRCAGTSVSVIDKVFVLAWKIDASLNGPFVPSSWKTDNNLIVYELPSDKVDSIKTQPVTVTLNNSNLVNGSLSLVNGSVYQVAAYALNTTSNLSSLYDKFATIQMKTGVPALLPTLSNFDDNFSLASIVNSKTDGELADGSLTVNSKNDQGLTGSDKFTFDPEYKILFADMDDTQLDIFNNVTTPLDPITASNLNILAGNDYKATITVSCPVPSELRPFWLTNPAGNWLDHTKTLENIVVDTTHKPSDLIVDSVVSGFHNELEVTVKCLGASISVIDEVYVLAWKIDASLNGPFVPSSWKTDNNLIVYKLSDDERTSIKRQTFSVSVTLSNNLLQKGSLVDGSVYQVAAYALNKGSNLSSLYDKFATIQMKTGIPALLPTSADFNDNFSLASIVNSKRDGEQADGSLTVNSKNDQGLTNSKRFTFDPTYTINFADIAGNTIGPNGGVPSNTPFNCSKQNLDVLAGTDYKATISISCSVPENLKKFWLKSPVQNWSGYKKTLQDIVVDTTEKPSDLVIDSVVSGLNGKLKVSVKCLGARVSVINDVYVLAWKISSPQNPTPVFVPNSWKDWNQLSAGILYKQLDQYQLVSLKDSTNKTTIDFDGLDNGSVYQVAAFAVNNTSNLSSLYDKFAIIQMKTGIPALLPTSANFLGNFSLTSVVNSKRHGELADGSLTVNSKNDQALTDYNKFTFDPSYTIIFADISGNELGPYVVASNTPFDCSKQNLDIVAGRDYKATISIFCSVPDNLKQFWLQSPTDEVEWSNDYKKTLQDIVVDTTQKPSDLGIDDVVSGLDGKLEVSVKCLGAIIDKIDEVYVLAWKIQSPESQAPLVVPNSWKDNNADILSKKLGIDDFALLKANKTRTIDFTGLDNGAAYQVAAYALNTTSNLSSLYEKFATIQMKTGIPASLPTSASFNDNFSLTSVVNSRTPGMANGSLTVNTNDVGLTGSNRFTFDPSYTIIFADMSDRQISSMDSLTPFKGKKNGLDILAGTNYKATISISCSVPANLQKFWLKSPTLQIEWFGYTKKLKNIVVDTSLKPSDLGIDTVVSGLDKKLQVTVKCLGTSVSEINDVYVLAWKIPSPNDQVPIVVPTSWKDNTAGILSHQLDANEVNSLKTSSQNSVNIYFAGLENGSVYKVAAYAVNNTSQLNSLYDNFATSQMKTGIPAYLPEFADYNDNFSLTSIVNSASLLAQANGSLTVNTKNLNNLTGNNKFTINPKYEITFKNLSNDDTVGFISSNTSFNGTKEGLNIVAGTDYKAIISISISVPSEFRTYWLTDPTNDWSNKEKTFEPIEVDTTNKPSDLIVDTVDSGSNSQLSVTIKCAGSAKSISQIKNVYILAWKITPGSVFPDSWKTDTTLSYTLDEQQVSGLRNSMGNSVTVSINSLLNGSAYQVAAYAVNAKGDLNSLYAKFALNQMKTGVPAIFPTPDDFKDNFTITGTLPNSINSGSLTISSSMTNSSKFTFSPIYSIKIYRNYELFHTVSNVTTFPCTIKDTIATEAGVYYNAIIEVITDINNNSSASSIKTYWFDSKNTENNVYKIDNISTVSPLYMSTLPGNPYNVSATVLRGNDINQLGFNNLSWEEPTSNGFSELLGYIVKVYNQDSRNIYTAYLPKNVKNISMQTDKSVSSGSSAIQIYPTNPYIIDASAAFGMTIPGTNYGMSGNNSVPDQAMPSEIYADDAFDAGFSYSFRISAVNKNGYGPSSTPFTLFMSQPPKSVTNLKTSQVLVVNYNEQQMPTTRDINISWELPTPLYGLKTNTIKYNIYGPDHTLLATVSDTKYIARGITNTTNFNFEIIAQAEDRNNVILYSQPTTSQFIFYKVPEITLSPNNTFSTDSNGNGKFYFSVDNGGSTLIGLLVMVLPDANIPTNIDPVISININPNNTYSVNSPFSLNATPRQNSNITDFILSLNYRIPDVEPSFLVVATNSVGNDIYSKNLSVTNA